MLNLLLNCIFGRKTQASVSSFTVRVNTLALNGATAGSVSRGVSKFVIHPSYTSSTNVRIFLNDLE
jgi:capsular polysaccharide biosynthesis protein